MTISKSKCRTALGILWFVTGGGLSLLFILQTLFGHYEDKANEAWAWFLPTLMPTLILMIGTFAADALTARDEDAPVKPFIFFLSFGISVFYLLAVALTILLQPLTGIPFPELMKQSNLFLGPLQGLVAAALGIFFVKARDNSPPTTAQAGQNQ